MREIVDKVQAGGWRGAVRRVCDAVVDIAIFALVLVLSSFALIAIAIAAPLTLVISAGAGIVATRHRARWRDLQTA